jgi:cytochrome c oxidase subunit II
MSLAAVAALAAGALPSVLDSAGVQAQRIERLWWVFFWVCIGVYVAVIAGFALALLRRPTAAPDPRRASRAVLVSTIATVLILFGFLVASVHAGRDVSSLGNHEPLRIEVTGYQWWWQVRYPGSGPAERVTTANEIHVPIGRQIALDLSSGDVIHSFWAPQLHGKTDLIPGRHNLQFLEVDRVGTFQGRCAEYCGYQHAHMGFRVVAEKPADFERWLAAQRAAAVEPSDPEQARGRQVFLSGPCVLCHSIRGTPAFGNHAPDLTHLASRQTIAASTLPNNRGALGGWISDSQGIKPGNHMPPMALPASDLMALLSYLESLR